MAYSNLTEDQIKILEDLPSSAVELQVKDKVIGFFDFKNYNINV